MINYVKPKKSLGQHFLHDRNIAEKIALAIPDNEIPLLEIGPGKGMLTGYLLKRPNALKVIEIDRESVEYLKVHMPQLLPENLIYDDFLKCNLHDLFKEQFGVIGNFPYNISSQILFKVLEYRDKIPLMCGMFQKEVAERIVSSHGCKQYGILSVLVQTWYDARILFTVSQSVFTPPPKVQSAILMLSRKAASPVIEDPKLFFRIVKAAFNQRRKMLKNSLSNAFNKELSFSGQSLRPEQLSVEDFHELYREVDSRLVY